MSIENPFEKLNKIAAEAGVKKPVVETVPKRPEMSEQLVPEIEKTEEEKQFEISKKKLEDDLLNRPGSVAAIDTFLLNTSEIVDSKIREECNEIVIDKLKSAAKATGQLQFDNKRNFEILMGNRRDYLSSEEQQKFRQAFEGE